MSARGVFSQTRDIGKAGGHVAPAGRDRQGSRGLDSNRTRGTQTGGVRMAGVRQARVSVSTTSQALGAYGTPTPSLPWMVVRHRMSYDQGYDKKIRQKIPRIDLYANIDDYT